MTDKQYSRSIREAAKAACDVLRLYYPDIFIRKYDGIGQPIARDDGVSFEQRLQMGLYIELLKAGERPELENIDK